MRSSASEFAAPEGSLVNERQRQARARSARMRSRPRWHRSMPRLDEAVILVDLYRAVDVARLAHRRDHAGDVFTEIFSKFCIGK